MRELHPVEALLGVRFADISRLERALTHRSYANERGTPDNERLEFLGDGLLNASVAVILSERFPQAREGQLSRLRTRLVCSETLAELGREKGLVSHMRRGAGERQSGPPTDSVVEALVEALVGAVFEELGWGPTLSLVRQLLAARLEALDPNWRHPKSRLQELIAARFGGEPDYVLRNTSGPAHEPQYSVDVMHQAKLLGSGIGRTVKEASTQAAAAALRSAELAE